MKSRRIQFKNKNKNKKVKSRRIPQVIYGGSYRARFNAIPVENQKIKGDSLEHVRNIIVRLSDPSDESSYVKSSVSEDLKKVANYIWSKEMLIATLKDIDPNETGPSLDPNVSGDKIPNSTTEGHTYSNYLLRFLFRMQKGDLNVFTDEQLNRIITILSTIQILKGITDEQIRDNIENGTPIVFDSNAVNGSVDARAGTSAPNDGIIYKTLADTHTILKRTLSKMPEDEINVLTHDMLRVLRNRTRKNSNQETRETREPFIQAPTPRQPQAPTPIQPQRSAQPKPQVKDDFDKNKEDFIDHLPDNIEWEHIGFIRNFLNDAKKKRGMFSLRLFKSAIRPKTYFSNQEYTSMRAYIDTCMKKKYTDDYIDNFKDAIYSLSKKIKENNEEGKSANEKELSEKDQEIAKARAAEAKAKEDLERDRLGVLQQSTNALERINYSVGQYVRVKYEKGSGEGIVPARSIGQIKVFNDQGGFKVEFLVDGPSVKYLRMDLRPKEVEKISKDEETKQIAKNLILMRTFETQKMSLNAQKAIRSAKLEGKSEREAEIRREAEEKAAAEKDAEEKAAAQAQARAEKQATAERASAERAESDEKIKKEGIAEGIAKAAAEAKATTDAQAKAAADSKTRAAAAEAAAFAKARAVAAKEAAAAEKARAEKEEKESVIRGKLAAQAKAAKEAKDAKDAKAAKEAEEKALKEEDARQKAAAAAAAKEEKRKYDQLTPEQKKQAEEKAAAERAAAEERAREEKKAAELRAEKEAKARAEKQAAELRAVAERGKIKRQAAEKRAAEAREAKAKAAAAPTPATTPAPAPNPSGE